MQPALEKLSSVFGQIHFMHLIEGTFLGLILVQVVTVLVCTLLLVNHGMMGDFRAFLAEYWKWDYLKRNLATLSLWSSSLAAYLTLWLVNRNIVDVKIAECYSQSPPAVIYVCAGLLGFVVYTLETCRARIVTTNEVAADLKLMRHYKTFKKTLKSAEDSEYGQSVWGIWVKPAARATEWVGDKLITHHVDNRMRAAVVSFAGSAAVEYALRMSTVLVAILLISM